MTIDILAAMKGRTSAFRVLGGTDRSQVAIMVLAPGEASSGRPSVHPREDQILYVIEGTLRAEIGTETSTVVTGQCAVVPAGTPHRFINVGEAPAQTLNVYAPPAY